MSFLHLHTNTIVLHKELLIIPGQLLFLCVVHPSHLFHASDPVLQITLAVILCSLAVRSPLLHALPDNYYHSLLKMESRHAHHYHHCPPLMDDTHPTSPNVIRYWATHYIGD
jgi:hypothetical protein